MKITPVLFLEAIEPALDFWSDRLGFEKVAEVQHEDALGFVMLVRDGAEIMLQTFASAEHDSAAAGVFARRSLCSLFIEVPDFADIVLRIGDYPVAMPVRDTFYGMREIGVEAPGGHMIVFAAPVPSSSEEVQA
ncbi:MAG: hypothetical protein H7Y20_12170 [Bryobacteraceae bacterium]|nr:hypothetical protein [Bryobacteraceae bacterium]